MDFHIPRQINQIMDSMNRAGHQVFIVGGCVRDILMGRAPEDWDLCTSARPEEIKECFSGAETIDIGMAHGTIAVIIDGKPIEITTYRIDGEYRDSRHPEKVTFTTDIEEDLARRDFTINSMAYNKERGLVDPFGGRMDIRKQVIRCVGNPDKRFSEDALRILRGLRFASTLGFIIEDCTAKAMNTSKSKLADISAERVSVELSKLLLGKNATKSVLAYGEIFKVFLPEIHIENGELLKNAKGNLIIALSLMIPEKGGQALRRLKFSNEIAGAVDTLTTWQRGELPADKIKLKEILSHMGLKKTESLIALKEAYGEDMAECRRLLKQIIEKDECYSLEQLAVNGRDLIEIGFMAGPNVGNTLAKLLEYVIQHPEMNKKEILLKGLARP